MLKWFDINEMKSNDDKCHLIIANQDNISITLGNECIEAEDSVELLGIKSIKILTLMMRLGLNQKRKSKRLG